MKHYALQATAVVAPASVSVIEVIKGGNLLLASAAALLALLAGRQRTEAETAELNKQIAELQLQRELDRDRSPRPPE